MLLNTKNELILPGPVESALPVSMPELALGTALADERFQVLEHVHANTYSSVYKAVDWDGEGEVAVKIFHEPYERIKRRVDRELEAHLLLDGQPGIVATRSMGTLELADEDQTRRYVATEFATRSTLSRVIREESWDLDMVLGMASKVIPALELMHEQGMVHRDVKPDNILAYKDADEWALNDFGLVERVAEVNPSSNLHGLGSIAICEAETVTFGVPGTPGFIAPESLKDNEAAGPEVDIFALGVTLFNAATGQMPFSSGGFEEYAWAVTNESPVSVRDLQSSVPASFDQLTAECLRKDPRDRPTAEGLLSSLQAV